MCSRLAPKVNAAKAAGEWRTASSVGRVDAVRTVAGDRRLALDPTTLTTEGCSLDPVGLRFDPHKSIVIVPAERAARIPLARQVPMRLGEDILGAQHLVLTPFNRAQ